MRPIEGPNANAQTTLIEIVTTFESREQAERVASQLVELGLVACAQVDGPVTSTYRWDEKVCVATEFRCTFKTTQGKQRLATTQLAERHPYDVPQIITVPITASAPYQAWVESCVSDAPRRP